MIRFRLCTLGRNPTEVILSPSLYIMWRRVLLISPSVINFGNFIKVVSARFFHCIVIVYC